jgi:hypothetical protein
MSKGKIVHKEVLGRSVDISSLTTVIHDKCVAIGRCTLVDVEGSEVVIKSFIKGTETYVCRIRGMTYAVCINKQRPSMGTFDPRPIGGPSGKATRRHSNDRVDDR